MATQGFIELGGFGALVDPQTVPRTGQDVRFRAGEGELDDLRQSLELGAARSASAELELRRRSGGGIEVSGRVRADVDQICVVSLDPFETAIDERVLVTFYPPEKLPAPDADAPGDDSEDTEPLEDGMLPLGALVRDTIALALDPYPRKPGVELPAAQEPGEERPSPFAVLSKLKNAD